MKPSSLLLASLLLASLALAACGDTTSGGGSDDNNNSSSNNSSANNSSANNNDNLQKPDGSACGSASRTGETRCDASVNGSCQAGQYCDNTTLACEVGCTSDNNCAGNQYCDITDGVGLCRNCIVQEPTPDPDPDPDPTPSNSSCEDGGDALRACGASAPDTAAFIAGCDDALSDPDLKPLVETLLRCIDLAADCDEQATCLEDEDTNNLNNNPNNNTPTPTDNMCDEAAAFALGCDLMDAAEAADFQATCEGNDAAGEFDDLAFCLSSAAETDDCEGAEFVCPL